MKNHYKSQLVINRFNRKIWFYDMEKRNLVQKQSHKIFYEEDIYEPEIEEKLHRLEATYSNIIDKKVLNQETIELTREELYLIKKFLLIDSIRQMYADGDFTKYFMGFEPSARRYFKAIETNSLYNPVYKMMIDMMKLYDHRYLSEMELSEYEKFMYSLKCILDNDISMLYRCNCPSDIIAWSAAMMESYLTFWDSAESEEFILTDVNMMSEYDMCHMVFGGIDAGKFSFLLAKARSKEASIYFDLIKTSQAMYENLNIFNLSNTRCIVCINPFFKLYSDRILELDKPGYKFPKPDIWLGTIVHHLEAYEIPKNKYLISHTMPTLDDLYYYKPYKLTLEETLALNMQLLNESRKFIGFVNKDKVKKTFSYANIALSFYDASKASDDKENPFAGLEAMTHSMMNNKFYPIMMELYEKGDDMDFNPFEVFDKQTLLSQEGMRTNYYMYEYFLKELKNNPNADLAPFEFLKKLGVTDLVQYFEGALKYAREHNKEFISDLYNNKL